MLLEGLVAGTPGTIVPLAVDEAGNIKIGGIQLEAPNGLEITNDTGNPLPMVGAAPRTATNATIANGAAVSGTVDLLGTALVGFTMPAAWTTAALSLEVSNDGTTWGVPYDSSASQVGLIATPVASGMYAVDVVSLLPWRYVRFKSSVNQGAARTITYVTRPLA